ncbi:hypothetical protein ACLIA0_04665 [Bacillaceae bacterium W0354]
MFNTKKFIEAVGISLLITIVFSFLIGFFEFQSVEGLIIINFLVSYVGIGILAPLLNRKTPYTAAFLGAIVVTLINLLFSVYVHKLPVFEFPELINNNLASSVLVTMITALVVVSILKRSEREAYD